MDERGRAVPESLRARIAAMRNEMRETGEFVRTHPETGLQERKSSAALSGALERAGFAVERGLGSLPTAFRARRRLGPGGPVVAFLAEYDALPGIGHGCAHHLVGTCSVYAAIALAAELAGPGARGEIVVLGTPAEEDKGGKIILLREGFFGGVDVALMSHPATSNEVGRGGKAITSLTVRFHGKGAHSSNPAKGVNALQAVMLFFHAIDALFQSFDEGVAVNGIVSEGGEADNVVPGLAECKYSIRGVRGRDVEATLARFETAARGVAIATGTTFDFEPEIVYERRVPNMTLELAFKECIEETGETVEVADPLGRYGSSDIGNVSLAMPAMHPYWRFWKGETKPNAHTREFAEAGGADEAYAGLERAVAALAEVGRRCIRDDAFLAAARKEFDETIRALR